MQNKKVIYDLLFRTSAETLLEVARDPQHLGAEIGFFSVLHSWTQKLEFHPHVHCVVPAGGLSADHTRWIKPRYDFFLPVEVLGAVSVEVVQERNQERLAPENRRTIRH
ncbi:MAG: transposase [Candidatus Acidiferrum sp.]